MKKLTLHQVNLCDQSIQSRKENSMTRTAILKVLNPILGIFLINQVITGLLNETLPHEAFEVLHATGGITLAAVAVLHVILNWNWVKANFRKKVSTN
jgi:hypothetical protein